jgi:hypothetical protein
VDFPLSFARTLSITHLRPIVSIGDTIDLFHVRGDEIAAKARLAAQGYPGCPWALPLRGSPPTPAQVRAGARVTVGLMFEIGSAARRAGWGHVA